MAHADALRLLCFLLLCVCVCVCVCARARASLSIALSFFVCFFQSRHCKASSMLRQPAHTASCLLIAIHRETGKAAVQAAGGRCGCTLCCFFCFVLCCCLCCICPLFHSATSTRASTNSQHHRTFLHMSSSMARVLLTSKGAFSLFLFEALFLHPALATSHAHTHRYTHRCTRTRTHRCTHTRARTHTHRCTHTHTQMHT